DHLEIDRAGKPDGFVEPRRGRTLARLRARPTEAGGPPAQIRTENHRAPAARACGPDQAVAAVAATRLQSGFFPGRRGLLAAFKQLDRMTRHDGRNGVLVDELRMAVPPQQHAEIIEPGDHALQLHPVHQEDGEWGLVLSHVIEEGILQILRAIGRHYRCSVFRSRTRPRETFWSVASCPPSKARPSVEDWEGPLEGTIGGSASPRGGVPCPAAGRPSRAPHGDENRDETR